MSELDGSELLLNNLDILTQQLDSLSRRVDYLEKELYGVRRDVDGNGFEIEMIHNACEQLASELIKLEKIELEKEYYGD